MIFVLDNYDSFTYNLVQYIGTIEPSIKVARNDEITVEEIEKLDPQGIIISPGPKTPKEAGISVEIVKRLSGKIPILGVCLGHQSIGYAFGADVILAPEIKHGKTSEITHNGEGIFQNIPNPMTATRYHSLIVKKETLPDILEITSKSNDGLIMALKVKNVDTYGVQFHPESILTIAGMKMIENFISICK